MEKFEFKSAICTTKEQSERLLALGLKKETADMYITNMSWNKPDYIDDWQIYSIPYCEEMSYLESNGLQLEKIVWSIIPAWSLNRLMEIMYNGDMFGFVSLTTHERNIDTIYDLVIANIEELIKINKFNKDYLEKKL